MKRDITIHLYGDDEVDIELALEEAVMSLLEGNFLGADSNETGGYTFLVTDPEHPVENH